MLFDYVVFIYPINIKFQVNISKYKYIDINNICFCIYICVILSYIYALFIYVFKQILNNRIYLIRMNATNTLTLLY